MAKLTKNIWDRSKDGNRKEQRSFLRYAIVVTALCFVFLLLKKDSLITWIGTGITLDRQGRQIERLEQDNAAMRDRIRALTESRDTLERFAREEYLFAAPGDDVYILE